VTTNPPKAQQERIAQSFGAVRWQLVASLAAVYLIWSSTYLGMKFAIATFAPMVLGMLRFLLAGGILLLLHFARGGRLPTRREVLVAMPMGVLMFVVGNGLIAMAQHEVASGVAAIVAATTPLWAALLGPLFGERAKAAEWVGVGLGTIGVALLGAHADLGSNWGMTLGLLLSPLGWALGSMLSRRTPQAPGFAGPGLQMLWGGVGMGVVAFVIGDPWPDVVSAETWWVIAYLVVFGSLVGFTAFNWLLQNTRPSLALSYSYVNPGIAVLLGVGIGHEPLHLTTLLATALLVVAVAVVVRSAVQRKRA
jgi:drug/metabolite transporter (DMT)-like permease